MKEEILKLRAEGKTYNQIVEILGCAKSTVAYHCGKGQKKKTYDRNKEWRKHNVLANKLSECKYRTRLQNSCADFKRWTKGGRRKNVSKSFETKEAVKQMEQNPYCYLTGRKIDFTNPSSYHLDHKIPVSKNGGDSLDNLGLCCAEANKAKSDMTPEEFIDLCREVLEHNGYIVDKKWCEQR
jgi:CRISPR/Cas system Type II protein with McrA/HNH and RuvC-like nuclease domain